MLEIIKNILWSPITVIFIAVVGIIISIKTSFRALRKPKKVLNNTIFSKNNSSSFEAMCTALGGTIGVGNTIGVAGAIYEGGPAALLWMLLASVFGMGIKEAEIYLAVKYKQAGAVFSGPMYYIEKGIGSKAFAMLWAVSCVFTAFGMGNISQSMAAVRSLNSVTGIDKEIISIFFTALIFILILSGMKGIKKALGACVPVITILFISVSLIIIYIQRSNLPTALCSIINSFFNGGAALSGVKWTLFAASMRAGFSRGIFTNEAGLGSASIVHSSSNESSPEKQAMWGVIEVFIDTVVICMLTGTMILTSNTTGISPEKVTLNIFFNSLGKVGASFYSVSMLIFALASIMAWYCYAECALKYLGFPNKYLPFFKLAFSLAGFLGGIIEVESVLNISDIFNAVMLITNLTALLLLSNKLKSN